MTVRGAVTAVAGNPKPGSRTLQAAQLVAERIAGRPADHVVDVVSLGPSLLGWGDATVTAARDLVAGSRLVVVASPTYKASYTGLLKTFLDQFEGGNGLRDVTVVPVMLGAAPIHQLAVEVHLRPVLAELGATMPAPGLFLMEKTFAEDGRIEAYAERWGTALRACAAAGTEVPA
jgi:FMN reductase